MTRTFEQLFYSDKRDDKRFQMAIRLLQRHADTHSKHQSPSFRCYVGYVLQDEMGTQRCGSPFGNAYSAAKGQRFVLVIHRASM